jgi:hypothetical protein
MELTPADLAAGDRVVLPPLPGGPDESTTRGSFSWPGGRQVSYPLGHIRPADLPACDLIRPAADGTLAATGRLRPEAWLPGDTAILPPLEADTEVILRGSAARVAWACGLRLEWPNPDAVVWTGTEAEFRERFPPLRVLRPAPAEAAPDDLEG